MSKEELLHNYARFTPLRFIEYATDDDGKSLNTRIVSELRGGSDVCVQIDPKLSKAQVVRDLRKIASHINRFGLRDLPDPNYVYDPVAEGDCPF